MISTENHMGKINISDKYITDIIKKTVSRCFGVAGISSNNLKDKILSELTGRQDNSGISIRISENRLTVNIHIAVTYGTNIQAVALSVRNKLRFVLSELVGVEVERVNIFVDEIVS